MNNWHEMLTNNSIPEFKMHTKKVEYEFYACVYMQQISLSTYEILNLISLSNWSMQNHSLISLTAIEFESVPLQPIMLKKKRKCNNIATMGPWW